MMKSWWSPPTILVLLVVQWSAVMVQAGSIFCDDSELCREGMEDNKEIIDVSKVPLVDDEDDNSVEKKQKFMAFGKRQDPFLRFGKRQDQDPFLRFGKRQDPFLRFGKRQDPFLRFGKRQDPFLRFGKRQDPFLRFGKRQDPFLRFGKRQDPFLRFGKRQDPFLRFGKRQDPFLRFGKRDGLEKADASGNNGSSYTSRHRRSVDNDDVTQWATPSDLYIGVDSYSDLDEGDEENIPFSRRDDPVYMKFG